jgi:hypothetical protein
MVKNPVEIKPAKGTGVPLSAAVQDPAQGPTPEATTNPDS